MFRKYVSLKRNSQDGVPILEEEVAVAWQDGGGPQLKAITRDDLMAADEDIKCTTNKHSASRSAVEQPMDLMSIFKFIIRNQKKLTSKRRAMIGFKQFVYRIFWELQKDGTLNLSIAKLHCIIDFTIIVPELMTQSMTGSRVIKGFVESGKNMVPYDTYREQIAEAIHRACAHSFVIGFDHPRMNDQHACRRPFLDLKFLTMKCRTR